MRIVLVVETGPQAGRKIELQPGQTLQIGRGREADLGFPEDKLMSGLHCVVQCGVKVCAIRDLGSTNGLLINGQKVRAAELKHGDRIVAGRTEFAVSTPFNDEALAKRSLVSVLRGDFQPLYAILDAARDPKILPLLRDSGESYQALYEVEEVDESEEIAPYLVRLPPDSDFLGTLSREAPGHNWGVYLTCDLPMNQIAQHLRRRLTVRLPNGDEVLFRYYDPRILSVYLPLNDASEVREFFGPIQSYLVEGETPSEYWRFWVETDGLKMAKFIFA